MPLKELDDLRGDITRLGASGLIGRAKKHFEEKTRVQMGRLKEPNLKMPYKQLMLHQKKLKEQQEKLATNEGMEVSLSRTVILSIKIPLKRMDLKLSRIRFVEIEED